MIEALDLSTLDVKAKVNANEALGLVCMLRERTDRVRRAEAARRERDGVNGWLSIASTAGCVACGARNAGTGPNGSHDPTRATRTAGTTCDPH